MTPHGHCTQIMESSVAREVGEKELERRICSEKLSFLIKTFKKTLTTTWVSSHALPKNCSNSPEMDTHKLCKDPSGKNYFSSFDSSKKTPSVVECWMYNPQSK